ncbi:MAG: EamA family transporter [Novosphingobium sp.]|nr:EamA family transporter [Novosphingobium sp.]
MSEAPPHALLRPRIAIPFLTISLIWGSTWVVIADQIETAPPVWSVVWRFAPATLGAFVLAMVLRSSLFIHRKAHLLAMALGLSQFCCNYVFVYHAELHLTSGIVAVMVSLLIVPNALLGRWILGQQVTPRFMLGSAVAITGIALLLLNEAQAAQLGRDVPLGVLFGLLAMTGASIASVVQAGDVGRSVSLPSLLAWSMFYGTLFDAAVAWAIEGPPTIPTGTAFWAGAIYLAVIGSVATFPLYWNLVREIGPGRAAYHGVLTVIIAMLLSTLFEGYRWSALAIAGSVLALAGLVIALRARNPVT